MENASRDRAPTLQDIADRLGLAKSTVSLGLRGRGTLSTRTRKRIQQTAREMGYRPDPLLSALTHRRKTRPADGVPVTFLSGEDNAVHRAFYTACSRHAAEWGYRMEHQMVTSPRETEIRLRECWHRGTKGLILHHIPAGNWLQSTSIRDFAVVQCRLHHDPLPFTTVRSDIVRKTHQTIERVTRAGHRRIGNIILLTTPDRSHPEDQDRTGGVLGAQERFTGSAEFPSPLFVTPEPGEESYWRKSARRWVKSNRLEAVVCTTDGLADMLFAGWAARPAVFCTLLDPTRPPRYAGMCDNTAQIGEKCLELVDHFIRTNRFGLPEHPYEVVIPSTWQDGETLPVTPRRSRKS